MGALFSGGRRTESGVAVTEREKEKGLRVFEDEDEDELAIIAARHPPPPFLYPKMMMKSLLPRV